jgi:hypothetical protein
MEIIKKKQTPLTAERNDLIRFEVGAGSRSHAIFDA